MNKQEIQKFLKDPSDISGRCSKESWIIKYHPNIYTELKNFINDNKLENIQFKEVVYLYINDLTSPPKCGCPECENIPTYRNKNIGYLTYCSMRCQGIAPDVRENRCNKNIELFGHPYTMLNEELKNKFKESIKKIDRKEQIRKMVESYHNNPNKSEMLKKRAESFKLNISKWKESFTQTSIINYGTPHPWMNPEVHNKSVFNTKLRFIDELKLKYPNVLDIQYLDKVKMLTIVNECTTHDSFDIEYNLFKDRVENCNILCTKCNDPKNSTVSSFQLSVLKYVESIYIGIIKKCTKTEIKLELDVYLPELKLAIECNGSYWHSTLQKTNDYHYKKYTKCAENGICLIQIWEDDWKSEKQNIIKNMIYNYINYNSKTASQILEIDVKTYSDFIEHNSLFIRYGSNEKYLAELKNDNIISVCSLDVITRELTNFTGINFENYIPYIKGYMYKMDLDFPKIIPISYENANENCIIEPNIIRGKYEYWKSGFKQINF